MTIQHRPPPATGDPGNLEPGDAIRMLQRQITERLLLSALRESDAADDARASQHRSAFLADAGYAFAQSLDEGRMHAALANLTLPSVADWCMVDLIDADGTMDRLTIVHRDPRSQALVRRLENGWGPRLGDAFGVPAVLATAKSARVTEDVDAALVAAAHDDEKLQVLRELDIGSLLTTPLLTNGTVSGAITFVNSKRMRSFTEQDVELAEALAERGSLSLQKAHQYSEALFLKDEAEREAYATSRFLRSMSHELRTPLQAIAGYVEIIDRGIHGPVTEDQRKDLDHILGSQRHLTVLIDDLLQFLRTGTGLLFPATSLSVAAAIERALDVAGPMIVSKNLTCRVPGDYLGRAVRADETRVHQILINLLANAIKFTGAGGIITIGCNSAGALTEITVSDTGRGIRSEKLQSIFEPFVQIHEGLEATHEGLGLGLSISRDLARTMHGDLSVESTYGQGSTFILTLPAADPAGQSGL